MQVVDHREQLAFGVLKLIHLLSEPAGHVVKSHRQFGKFATAGGVQRCVQLTIGEEPRGVNDSSQRSMPHPAQQHREQSRSYHAGNNSPQQRVADNRGGMCDVRPWN